MLYNNGGLISFLISFFFFFVSSIALNAKEKKQKRGRFLEKSHDHALSVFTHNSERMGKRKYE